MWLLIGNVVGESCIHRRIKKKSGNRFKSFLFGGLMAGNKKKRNIPSSRVIKIYIKLKKKHNQENIWHWLQTKKKKRQSKFNQIIQCRHKHISVNKKKVTYTDSTKITCRDT